ncbi:MAG: hypothetical protein P1V35_06355 [Planctomycetota bacterium]|nr:hypothetical protein [Planctomycetota bacterium]
MKTIQKLSQAAAACTLCATGFAQDLPWTLETVGSFGSHSRPAALEPFVDYPDSTILFQLTHRGTLFWDLTLGNTGTTPIHRNDVVGWGVNQPFLGGGSGPGWPSCWQINDPNAGPIPVSGPVTIPAGGSIRLTGSMDVSASPGAFFSVRPVYPASGCFADGLHGGGTLFGGPMGISWQFSGTNLVVTDTGSHAVHDLTIRTQYALPPASSDVACPQAHANSSGQVGQLEAFGATDADEGYLVLQASSLPVGEASYYILADQTTAPQPLGSGLGTLCLGGQGHRWRDSFAWIPAGGTTQFAFEPSQVPVPGGVQAGETWNFQLWHRDQSGGQSTSNTTEAIGITFQ